MSRDKNQVIELWRSLSPRLTRAIPDDELLKRKHLNKKKTAGVNEDQIAESTEGHREESDV